MKAQFGLPSVEGESVEGKPPIQVKFEIPYFTTSGIQVGISIFYRSQEIINFIFAHIWAFKHDHFFWGALHNLSNTILGFFIPPS